MYKDVGEIRQDTMRILKSVLDDIDNVDLWERHLNDVTNHQAISCMGMLKIIQPIEIVEKWPDNIWEQLLFLRIPPGGNLYRHADMPGFGFHIPIETNDDCESITYPDNKKIIQHLKAGRIYKIDRGIEHESFNNGNTNRTHLIILLKEQTNV